MWCPCDGIQISFIKAAGHTITHQQYSTDDALYLFRLLYALWKVRFYFWAYASDAKCVHQLRWYRLFILTIGSLSSNSKHIRGQPQTRAPTIPATYRAMRN